LAAWNPPCCPRLPVTTGSEQPAVSRRNNKPEQIMTLLRQVTVMITNGRTTPKASRQAGIREQTFYRWRKEYGALKLDQAKRLKALEQENAKLKRLIAELSLERQILKDVAAGNLYAQSVAGRGGTSAREAWDQRAVSALRPPRVSRATESTEWSAPSRSPEIWDWAASSPASINRSFFRWSRSRVCCPTLIACKNSSIRLSMI
jgi:putative transposase